MVLQISYIKLPSITRSTSSVISCARGDTQNHPLLVLSMRLLYYPRPPCAARVQNVAPLTVALPRAPYTRTQHKALVNPKRHHHYR